MDVRPLEDVFQRLGKRPRLRMIDAGAAPLAGHTEPFYDLLDRFPGSRVLAFEVDPARCQAWNQVARDGVTFRQGVLAEQSGRRSFYVTENPLCSSLRRPAAALLDAYQNLGHARLTAVETVQATTLDDALAGEDAVDFVKLDVQGAELDVLRGGVAALDSVIAIVAEVAFLPLYDGQPLFGEVCAWLDDRGLRFHKFLGVAGRTLKPVVLDGDPNRATQHLWADALFVRDPLRLELLSPRQLLVLAIYAELYASPDLAYACLSAYDAREGTALASSFAVTP